MPDPFDPVPAKLVKMIERCEAQGFGPAISCEELLRELGLFDGEES